MGPDGLPLGGGKQEYVYVGQPGTCWATAKYSDSARCGRNATTDIELCDECYEEIFGCPAAEAASSLIAASTTASL